MLRLGFSCCHVLSKWMLLVLQAFSSDVGSHVTNNVRQCIHLETNADVVEDF